MCPLESVSLPPVATLTAVQAVVSVWEGQWTDVSTGVAGGGCVLQDLFWGQGSYVVTQAASPPGEGLRPWPCAPSAWLAGCGLPCPVES